MKSNHIVFSGFLLAFALVACQPVRNFTTYYNRFYNMERIMDEVEDELQYTREQKTPTPTYYIPYDDLDKGSRTYNHLERRSLTAEEAKANKLKTDSILIKGSMLLVRSPKSDYVPDAVFYIGKAYFYQREWYQAQKKEEELIANFPESEWLPDAHLFLAMSMLQQGNVEGATTMLSRTIDIAWGHRRRDLLIEAFRLNADIAMADGNLDRALKPYNRAIMLSSDDEEKARWQYEIGVLYFRTGDFASAVREFDKVSEYSPNIITQFQTGLQRAVALRTRGEYDLAEKQLDHLRGNGNFEEWWGMVEMERLNIAADRPGGSPPSDADLTELETKYRGKSYAAYSVYERGIRAFRAGDYSAAYQNFQKVQSAPVPFQRRAQRYTILLSEYRSQLGTVTSLISIPQVPFPDSVKIAVAEAYYNVARVFAAFDIRDSLSRYYDLSSRWAPDGSLQAARAIYARAIIKRETDQIAESDSLMEILAQPSGKYQLTEYAADARARLGYTDAAVVDSAAEAYRSGIMYMRVGEYANALPKFQHVASAYSQSSYAPQSLYAIGLMYEEHLNNYDSAFAYYVQVLNRYPNSEQAFTVKPIVDAVLAARAKRQPPGELNQNPADSSGVRPPTAGLTPEGLVPLDQSDHNNEAINNSQLQPPVNVVVPQSPARREAAERTDPTPERKKMGGPPN